MKQFMLVLMFSGLLIHFVYARLTPTRLTCEYVKDPSVVDVRQPRLAWINTAEPGERGQE